jgi:hypothetical protein
MYDATTGQRLLVLAAGQLPDSDRLLLEHIRILP